MHGGQLIEISSGSENEDAVENRMSTRQSRKQHDSDSDDVTTPKKKEVSLVLPKESDEEEEEEEIDDKKKAVRKSCLTKRANVRDADESDFEEIVTPARRKSRLMASSSSSVRRSGRIESHESKLRSRKKPRFSSLDTALNFQTEHSRAEEEENSDGEENSGKEFVVNDDVVEYEPPDDSLPVESGDDEEQVEEANSSDSPYSAERDLEVFHAMAENMPLDKWFPVYMEYLAQCLTNKETAQYIHTCRGNHKVIRLLKAAKTVQRELCSRRDSITTMQQWNPKIIHWLERLPFVRCRDIGRGKDVLCQVCNRGKHPASLKVYLEGIPMDSSQLYEEDWLEHFTEEQEEDKWQRKFFLAGATCYQRLHAFADFLHSKRLWVTMLQDERLSIQHETSRFKSLVSAVMHFNRRWVESTAYSPRWDDERKIQWRNYNSTRSPVHSEAVSESSSEEAASEETDEEEMKTTTEAENRVASDADDSDDSEVEIVSSNSPTTEIQNPVIMSLSPPDEQCLMCRKRPMTGCIVHGNYCHVYSCYTCAKQLEQQGKPCLICGRNIDSVVNKLPLSQASKARIEKLYP